MTDLINTASGAKISIGPANPTLTTPLALEADYAGLSYTQVTGVQTMGKLSRAKKEINFTALEDGEERIYPGVFQANKFEVNCGKNSVDPGQQALQAAALTKGTYAFKLELADKREADFSDTVIYFTGFVLTADVAQVGSDTSVVMSNFVITAQTSTIVEDPAHFVT